MFGSVLEQFRGTFFRQTQLAEFELAIHEAAERGEALSGEKMSEIYLGILKTYYAPAVTLDALYGVEWAYIPHFYNAFYVFQYATSISAGSLFADDILSGKPGAREKYLKLISSGGSDYPYELVKAAGVDLANGAVRRRFQAHEQDHGRHGSDPGQATLRPALSYSTGSIVPATRA
jgi:oligoendopeptidase F